MLSCYPGNRPVAEALYRVLRFSGIDSLGLRVPFERKKVLSLGFQYVGVEMLVREYNIASGAYRGHTLFECEGKRLIGGRGEEKADHYVTKRDGIISYNEILELLKENPFPIIVIDMSLTKIHTDEELASLRVQVAMSLTEVRSYLWDRHLALSSSPEGIEEWLHPLVGKNKMIITSERTGELLWKLKADKVIILRPDAKEPLRPSEVMQADAFVIGGIVDKIPRPGLSRMLDHSVPWGEPRRLEIRGSTVGVPERIHRIVGALLKARLDLFGLVERSLIAYMARQDRVFRLHYELQKRGVKRAGLCSLLREFRWLNVDQKDLVLAAKRAKVELYDDCR